MTYKSIQQAYNEGYTIEELMRYFDITKSEVLRALNLKG